MKALLKESLVKVLEGAAFVFTDELPPERIPEHGKSWGAIGVGLEFEGSLQRGTVDLWLSEELSDMIAINMLGLEPSDECTEEQSRDASKEILNMVVGIFLTEAFGVEEVFHLGIPRIIPDSAFAESSKLANHFWIDADGHSVMMSLQISA